jgi:hypothetical protein
MSYFPPYLRVATICLLNLPALLFRWTRGVELRFLPWPRRWLLGRPLHRSTPMKVHVTHSFLLQSCIFFIPTDHYVRDNYSVLSNVAPAYHIVIVRVIWISWAHVWRLCFCFLWMGYDSFSPKTIIEAVIKAKHLLTTGYISLLGPDHQHAIGTFHTCSRELTHRSIIDTGGGYNLGGAGLPHHTPRPSQPTVLCFPPKGPI